ncbi:MAG: rhodanese-like domain-containing protein [Halothiobacillaceae bacterium]|jgi:rhodanese-related sulfurtransferase|nr:rhodanese-like domain-containing protein [Halothiobacillaceae bacterium]MDY0050263.1 rhodanese-like domain-containing protein [Halothiobacillaceae bacterium]
MEQLPDFLQRHWLLTLALFGIIGLMAAGEVSRKLRRYTEISPAEAARLIGKDDTLLLDVREPDEFRQGHIRNATHVPLGKLAARVAEFEAYKDKPVVIYCRSGNRSGVACAQLAKQGFTIVHNLAGGILAWQHDNLPVKKK